MTKNKDEHGDSGGIKTDVPLKEDFDKAAQPPDHSNEQPDKEEDAKGKQDADTPEHNNPWKKRQAEQEYAPKQHQKKQPEP